MKKVMVLLAVISSYCFGSNYTVVDAHGNTHNYNKTFSRIISLYSAHTEILTDIGATDTLIGISSDRHTKPIEGITIFNLGDSAEKFISLNPDLILIRPMIESKYKDLIAMLRSRGVEVISLHPKTGSELEEYWLSLGRLTGREEASKEYFKNFNIRLSKLRDSGINKDIKIFFEARYSRTLYTNAKDSMASYILDIAGLKNALEGESGSGSSIIPIRQEELFIRGADIELYIAQRGTMNMRSISDIKKSNGYNLIRAVREDHILILDERLVSRPTNKILDAVEIIVSYLDELNH